MSSNLSFTAKFSKRNPLIFLEKIGGLWFLASEKSPYGTDLGQMLVFGAKLRRKNAVALLLGTTAFSLRYAQATCLAEGAESARIFKRIRGRNITRKFERQPAALTRPIKMTGKMTWIRLETSL